MVNKKKIIKGNYNYLERLCRINRQQMLDSFDLPKYVTDDNLQKRAVKNFFQELVTRRRKWKSRRINKILGDIMSEEGE